MQNLKDINWNHLYYFYEVSRAQSLKKASEYIGVTSATLSEQIKRLEEKFGRKLFHRDYKGLTLTADGELLFNKAKHIFEEGSRVLEYFSGDVVGGYPVSVGIEETLSYDLAIEFSSQYWDLYTQYGIVNTVRQPEHETLIDNLKHGNIDWGISLKKPKGKSLAFEEIGSFEVVFCCSEDLFDKFKDPKDILGNIPFAQTSWDKNVNEIISEHLRNHGIMPKEKIFSDHQDFIKKLCERGRCVMFLPYNPLGDYQGLKTFSLDKPIKTSLYAIWKKSEEGMIPIIKLKELIQSKLTDYPERYEDIDFQIEISEVSDELLK